MAAGTQSGSQKGKAQIGAAKSLRKRSIAKLASIKKRPPPRQSYPAHTTPLYISPTSPFISILKRVTTLLLPKPGPKERRGVRVVVLVGMGRAMERCLGVALRLQDEGLHGKEERQGVRFGVEVRTGTVGVVDDVVPDDEDEMITCQVRKQSMVEVFVTVKGAAL
ncbi:hypothetical protein SAICODRAFT_144700 [Saitoella complicata NRRL Y-17804]|uniref:Uncharacterized protein n=1 Tax=Saitoella complicata (strain BCRC 22490 / CBS 7301 / JCM 7358 / NBRC 10748 / NRRL Y-17804) TaxID=698492 RepID=A0A0E9NNX6_SAICN|nr:uncharacterized protein SAICODRAFT_144700 [Saitoella complicata NRRL Y-17804]ODQ51817.1 hypothetical protein SAICODRAFT_144700 [Saitoella complicata NRRL Y-17804]GAO51371.1 hypothetical protein G7K_5473-t1 [Saitoella complicata NRRL Y-17804]